MNPQTESRGVILALSVAALLLTGGCASLGGPKEAGVTRADLPADWSKALFQPAGTRLEVAGAYLNAGDFLNVVFDGVAVPGGHQGLVEAMFQVSGDVVGSKPVDQVTLRQPDAGHLEVTARFSGAVVMVKVFEVTIETATGALVLTRSQSTSGAGVGQLGPMAGASSSRKTLRLWRGSDGSLYGQSTSSRMGAGVWLVVPVVYAGSGLEAWSRWQPAGG